MHHNPQEFQLSYYCIITILGKIHFFERTHSDNRWGFFVVILCRCCFISIVFLSLFRFVLFAEFIEISTKKENKTQSHNNNNYSTGSHLSMWNVWSFNGEHICCAIHCGIKVDSNNKGSALKRIAAIWSKLSQLFEEKTLIGIAVVWMPILIKCFNSRRTKEMSGKCSHKLKRHFAANWTKR